MSFSRPLDLRVEESRVVMGLFCNQYGSVPHLKIRYCQRQFVREMSCSRLLDLRVEESRVVRHVKSPRYAEAPRKSRALSRARTQAIGALAHGFTH